MLREYLGLRGTRDRGSGEDYTQRNFMICTPHQVLFNPRRVRCARHVTHVVDRGGVYKVRCGDHLENVGVD
jgi:hypothetical protein